MAHKTYKHEFSPLAERDLNETFDYITLELSSSQAAVQLIDSIQTAVENICVFPYSRPLLKDKILRGKGYRLLIVRNFNIFYIVERQTVIIRRVLHGSRNYELLL